MHKISFPQIEILAMYAIFNPSYGVISFPDNWGLFSCCNFYLKWLIRHKDYNSTQTKYSKGFALGSNSGSLAIKRFELPAFRSLTADKAHEVCFNSHFRCWIFFIKNFVLFVLIISYRGFMFLFLTTPTFTFLNASACALGVTWHQALRGRGGGINK